MELLVVALLVVFLGSVLGIIAFMQVRELQFKVKELEATLAGSPTSKPSVVEPKKVVPKIQEPPPTVVTPISVPVPKPVPKKTPITRPSQTETPLASTHSTWMTWMGALCVALAGIFMGRYALEQGWLGPMARVAAGVLAGIALHAGAELLRRKTGRTDLSFAALAAGGTITLFASLTAALHWYELISPTFVFIALTVVALLTLNQAKLYGPLYALFGMLAAYIVPALVSTGSGQVWVAMIYALIITVAVALLLNYVYRSWLWIGMMSGILFWWLVSLGKADYDLFRVFYLCAAIMVIAVIDGGIFSVRTVRVNDRLQLREALGLSGGLKQSQLTALTTSVLAIVLVLTLQFNEVHEQTGAWLSSLIVVGFIAYRNDAVVPAAWLLTLGLLVAPLLDVISTNNDHLVIAKIGYEQVWPLCKYLAGVCAVTAVFSVVGMRANYMSDWRASLSAIPPVMALAVVYLLSSASLVGHQWFAMALITGLIYGALIRQGIKQGWLESWRVWLTLSAHFCYSLAVVSLFSDQILSAALAAQVVSLAFMMSRYQLQRLGWMLKVLIVLLLGRLTLGPWVWEYDTAPVYNLIVCMATVGFVYIAMQLLADDKKLSPWLQGAWLHFIALSIFTFIRWSLYGEYMYRDMHSPTEIGYYCSLSLALGLVYYIRSNASNHLVSLYKLFSGLLVLAGSFFYVMILWMFATIDHELMKTISYTEIFNALWLYLGLPVLLFAALAKWHAMSFRPAMAVATALSFLIFVSVQIRHLWHGSVDMSQATFEGELYTYSAVWMTIAIATMVYASVRRLDSLYKGGLALLAVVVAKLFLVDMSQLEGIYRIVSFLGLGLGLLGVAYLDRRLRTPADIG